MKVTILLSAILFESEIIRKLLKGRKIINGYEFCVLGHLGRRNILIANTGVGGVRCENVLDALLDKYFPSDVLFLGTAGAINPALKIGDVVVANTPIYWILQENEKLMPKIVFGATCPKNDLLGISRGSDTYFFNIFRGSVVTWDEPVINKTMKLWLSNGTGAYCVDMETGYVGQLCKKRKIPFLAVRGISDITNEDENEYGHYHHNKVQAVWNSTIVTLEALSHSSPISMWPIKYL